MCCFPRSFFDEHTTRSGFGVLGSFAADRNGMGFGVSGFLCAS